MIVHLLLILQFTLASACHKPQADPDPVTVLPGAYNMDNYLDLIKDQRIGLVVNHTSMLDNTHLVDTLLNLEYNIRLIFSPEHGFKGTAYNGEKVDDSAYDGISIKSLYGSSKKPSSEDLEKVDILLFDIQDVGARFYTYISTLHYVMEAAAESDIPVIILDRPNPNAHYVDGPIMQEEHSSFVGLHPVPVVYGMTIGEYGHMINGEGWLTDGIRCDLKVIPIKNYDHQTEYILPIPPSPNLPNPRSIYLYPSLCFLEGTVISAGRGTNQQFQIYGHPKMDGSYEFRPKSMSSSKYPKHEGELCFGMDLTRYDAHEYRRQARLDLSHLIHSFNSTSVNADSFFLENGFFELLAGTDVLRNQIINGVAESEIRASWQAGLEQFASTRSKYLIYP